jgi:hypothetical protein
MVTNCKDVPCLLTKNEDTEFLCNDALAPGFVGYVCSKKFLPPFPSQFHACACFITIFIVYFLVISC